MSSTEKKQESSSEKDRQILTNLSADMQINKSERKDNAIQNVETGDEGLKREDVNTQDVATGDEGLKSEDVNVQIVETGDEGIQREDANIQDVETGDEGIQSEDVNVQIVETGDEGIQREDANIQGVREKKKWWWNCPNTPIIRQLATTIIFPIIFILLFRILICLDDNFSKIDHSIQEKREIKIKLMEEINYLKETLDHSSKNLTRLENEYSQVKQHLNSTLQEKAELQQTLIQLKDKNRRTHSMLSSNKLSFIWNVCQKDTLQCSRCPPGWTEHSLRCFMMSRTAKKWEDGRRECLDNHGDLAVVLTATDQAFLTNFTIQFVRMNPTMDFHSAWIGLQDMVLEGTFIWVNGEKLKSNLSYWREMEPNNAIASWDADSSGQDCVAIVPPKSTSGTKWLHSWDDIICGGKRNFICEVPALVLP